CKRLRLRLRQGDDTRVCSGLAEVFYNGTWGSVCGNDMTGDTATVICRQLGCGDSESYDQVATSLPPGSPFWLDNIKCGVHNETLWQCPSSPWGENDCINTETAKITCTEPTLPPETQFPLGLSVLTAVLGVQVLLLLIALGVLVFHSRAWRRDRYACLNETIYQGLDLTSVWLVEEPAAPSRVGRAFWPLKALPLLMGWTMMMWGRSLLKEEGYSETDTYV
ncbi:hypothetical protein JZ751_029571, partial [Albula glossodonta]